MTQGTEEPQANTEQPLTPAPATVDIPAALGVPERTEDKRGANVEYIEARRYLVRQEYARVRAFLKLVAENGRPETSQAAALLQEARSQLLAVNPDARAAAGAISQADQNLVWCDSMTGLKNRAEVLARLLTTFRLTDEARALQAAMASVQINPDGTAIDYNSWQLAAGQVEIAIRQVDACVNDQWTNDDLQVARLKLLSKYAAGALLLILAVTTVAANPSPVDGWPVHALARLADPLSALLASLAIAVVGAVGGLFSTLLVTQSAPASLLAFRTSVQRLTLRPLVGAMVSVVVYIALSWQVIPGITVTNGGTFVVIGFATGFSERYILRLLNVAPAKPTKPAR